MLRPTGEGRFALLETLREFALSRLAADGLLDDARERHISHYAALVRMQAPVLPERYDGDFAPQLILDEPEVRAVLVRLRDAGRDAELQELVASLGITWFFLGRLVEGRSWLEEALSRPFADLRWKGIALFGLANLALRQEGQQEAQFEAARAAVDVFRELQDDPCLGRALNLMSAAFYRLGEFDRAAETSLESAHIARAVGDDTLLALTVGNSAYFALGAGNLERALELAAEAVALVEVLGDQNALSAFLHSRGMALLMLERLDEAEADFKRALANAPHLPMDLVTSPVDGLAAVAAGRRQWQRAATLLGAVAAVVAETDDYAFDDVQQRIHDDVIRLTELALGGAAFERILQDGRGLPMSDILARALDS